MNEKKESIKGIEFNLIEIKEKPTRGYKKGSKYDGLLDQFIESKKPLVSIEIKDVDANYLRTQLFKRVTARKLQVKPSVINNVVYLERELELTIKKVKV